MFRLSWCENLPAQQVVCSSSPFRRRGEQHLFLPPSCSMHNSEPVGNVGPGEHNWRCGILRTGPPKRSQLAYNFKAPAMNLKPAQPPIPPVSPRPPPSHSSATLLTTLLLKPDFLYETGIFQQRFHGYSHHSPGVSASVTPPPGF